MAVSRDATSGWYAPASAAEWTELLAGTGISNPTSLYLLQEASGNFADSIASNTLSNSTLLYRRSVPGWTRVGPGLANDGAGELALTTAIGNVGATSALFLAFVYLPSLPAANRDIMGMGGGSSHRYVQLTTTGALRLSNLNSSAVATGAESHIGRVTPIVLQVDRTSSVCRIVTDLETITQSPYSAPPAGSALLDIGRAVNACAVATYLYATYWSGADSEMDGSEIATLLDRMQNGVSSGVAVARNRLVNAGRMGALTKGSSVN